MLEHKIAAAGIVTVLASFSLLAPVALAASSPLSCTTSSNSATSSDGSMGVKATAGTCPNGTNNAWDGYDAYTGGKYAATGNVGTACGSTVSVTNAYDFWFGEAAYGSGCDPHGTQNFTINTGFTYQFPGESGGVTVSIVGWSGNCNTYGSSSSCTAETSAT
jgi:hypothetical protein